MNQKSVLESILTIKNVLRVFSVICFIIFFCPTFLVSCSGKDIDISALDLCKGIETRKDSDPETYPVLLILAIIPLIILIALTVKKITENEKLAAGIVAGAALIDTIIWFILRQKVKEKATSYMCNFKTTAWFVIDIIIHLLIILFALIVVIGKLKLETDFISLFNQAKNGMQNINVSTQNYNENDDGITLNAGQDESTGEFVFCTKCGTRINKTSQFCKACGEKQYK